MYSPDVKEELSTESLEVAMEVMVSGEEGNGAVLGVGRTAEGRSNDVSLK